MTSRVGDAGIEPDDLAGAEASLAKLTTLLNERHGTGMEGWRALPFDPARSQHLSAVQGLADELRPDTENLIVLGIGGSALGLIALQSALNPATYNLMPRELRNGPRMFVLDNVDPINVSAVIDEVRRTDPDLQRTVVNVVTKSGETAETAAQFLLLRSLLRQALPEAYARRIIAVTDPASGTMRSICDKEGYRTLPIPEGVGGRFSVLSPVGLFGAAMCGIDVAALLDGAAVMDERCRTTEIRSNPAAILGWLLTAHAARGRHLHVLMPYCNALYLMADWFRQLWAESLGKRVDVEGRVVHAGPTPIKALGTTDQHSQVQLYREGPNDKVIGFVQVQDMGEPVKIPADLDVEALAYLQGANLGALLAAEKRATEYALVESQRPNYTLTLPAIDANVIGQFIQLWELVAAYAGLLLNINTYDQPAVETGKLATFGLMGRPGYEKWQTKVDQALGDTDWQV